MFRYMVKVVFTCACVIATGVALFFLPVVSQAVNKGIDGASSNTRTSAATNDTPANVQSITLASLTPAKAVRAPVIARNDGALQFYRKDHTAEGDAADGTTQAFVNPPACADNEDPETDGCLR